jgi:hypothetical protein
MLGFWIYVIAYIVMSLVFSRWLRGKQNKSTDAAALDYYSNDSKEKTSQSPAIIKLIALAGFLIFALPYLSELTLPHLLTFYSWVYGVTGIIFYSSDYHARTSCYLELLFFAASLHRNMLWRDPAPTRYLSYVFQTGLLPILFVSGASIYGFDSTGVIIGHNFTCTSVPWMEIARLEINLKDYQHKNNLHPQLEVTVVQKRGGSVDFNDMGALYSRETTLSAILQAFEKSTVPIRCRVSPAAQDSLNKYLSSGANTPEHRLFSYVNDYCRSLCKECSTNQFGI